MATKTVYVSKGDLVRLRYIPDPNAPRTQAVWKERLRPTTQCFWVLEYDLIGVAPDLGVADVGLGGKIKGYLSAEPKLQAEIDAMSEGLVKAHDAFIEGDMDEVYHQIYTLMVAHDVHNPSACQNFIEKHKGE